MRGFDEEEDDEDEGEEEIFRMAARANALRSPMADT
jgi:hypothetical protein